MFGFAIKMLFGDLVKLAGLVFGIAFSALLINQQGGFFVSLVSRSANIINEDRSIDIWVMDPRTETVESPTGMRAIETYRVRGVEGVATADPVLRATAAVRADRNTSGTAAIIGVDEAQFTGITPRFILGSVMDLQQADAIAIDILGYSKLWPGEPLSVGKTLEINQKRAVVTGITDAAPGFTAPIVIYTTLSRAVDFTKADPGKISFVVVKADGQANPANLAVLISRQTGLTALTSDVFRWRTVDFVLKNTGIAPSFGVVIALGAVVGIVVCGLTFTLFVKDYLSQFAMLKALGMSNTRLLLLVLAQAALVAFIGFAIGLWLATGFFDAVNQPDSDLKGFWLPWQVAALSAMAIFSITILASLLAVRRVLRLDPATVFRG